MKADVLECVLDGCKRIGVLRFAIYDNLSVISTEKPTVEVYGNACCKTHILKYLTKQKMPRYSKKAVQRLAGTHPLKLEEPKAAVRKYRCRASGIEVFSSKCDTMRRIGCKLCGKSKPVKFSGAPSEWTEDEINERARIDVGNAL